MKIISFLVENADMISVALAFLPMNEGQKAYLAVYWFIIMIDHINPSLSEKDPLELAVTSVIGFILLQIAMNIVPKMLAFYRENNAKSISFKLA